MPINVYSVNAKITFADLGHDLNSRTGITSLRSWLRGLLVRVGAPVSLAIPSNLQSYVDLYSEQVTADPLADLTKYFRIHGRRGTTPGGVPTGGITPIVITARDMKPSNTAISALGEGIAGWYSKTQLGMNPRLRPIGEGPDFILEDASMPSNFALVEVKATQEPQAIVDRLLTAAPDGLQFLRNAVDSRTASKYSLLLMGLVIRSNAEYDLWNLHISLV